MLRTGAIPPIPTTDIPPPPPPPITTTDIPPPPPITTHIPAIGPIHRIGTLTAGGDAKHRQRAAPFEPPLTRHCLANSENDAEEAAGTTMVDRSGLRLVGFIFASVTFAVMLTTTMVVKGYSDGVYSLESAAIEGR